MQEAYEPLCDIRDTAARKLNDRLSAAGFDDIPEDALLILYAMHLNPSSDTTAPESARRWQLDRIEEMGTLVQGRESYFDELLKSLSCAWERRAEPNVVLVITKTCLTICQARCADWQTTSASMCQRTSGLAWHRRRHSSRCSRRRSAPAIALLEGGT